MKEKNLHKVNQKYKTLIVLIIIFSLFLVGSIVVVDFTSDATNGWMERMLIAGILIAGVATFGLIISVVLIFLLDKKFTKMLNEVLDPGFEVIRKIACYDLIDDALLYVQKRRDFTCNFGLVGKAEDIDFEYYHMKIAKETFFFNKDLGFIDLYVFKNVDVFLNDIVISTGEGTKAKEDYKKYKINDYIIYAKNEENWEGLTLPKDAFYFSIVDHKAYLFISTKENEFSKPYHFKTLEDFKIAVHSKIDQTINLYAEIKIWL